MTFNIDFPKIKIKNTITSNCLFNGYEYVIQDYNTCEPIIYLMPDFLIRKYYTHFTHKLDFVNKFCDIKPNNIYDLLLELEIFLINNKERIEKLLLFK